MSRTGVSMHSGTPATVQTLYIRRESKLKKKEERRGLRGKYLTVHGPTR